MKDAIIRQVALALDAIAQDEARFDQKVRELEAEGYRIVGGGGTNNKRWEYTDWRTGESLAKGHVKDRDKHEPPENWYHVDHVMEEAWVNRPELVEIDDLPPDLAHAVASAVLEWTDNNREEALAFIDRLPPNTPTSGCAK
jgi:hypothetical protein